MDSNEVAEALKNVKLFGGVYACDELPTTKRKKVAFVVNTDKAQEPGEHWVVVYLKPKKKAEYFDSFGFPPIQKDIYEWLGRHADEWRYSCRTLQHPSKQSCGLFCISFIQHLESGGSYRSFLNKFTTDLSVNEKLINGVESNDNQPNFRLNRLSRVHDRQKISRA